MRILIIRHGDPDYPNNTLTPTGFLEAEALGRYYKDAKLDAVYASPLPRAFLTAEALAKHHPGLAIQSKDWLVEFGHKVTIPQTGKPNLVWDYQLEDFDANPDLLDGSKWLDSEVCRSGDIRPKFEAVEKAFLAVLAEHGYVKEGGSFRVQRESKETLVFVCHFGMMCVLLSALTGLPFTGMAQRTCCLPTGVTELVTEERKQGIAQFRMLQFGNLDHLRSAGMEPSFAARFCEVYSDPTRH